MAYVETSPSTQGHNSFEPSSILSHSSSESTSQPLSSCSAIIAILPQSLFKGLLKVTEQGLEAIVSDVSFANDVIEASDGSLYFTASSTRYTPADYYKDTAEGEPYEQLRKCDPILK
ncbi:hypothetical protein WN944_018768 [Citrus x changshan-huyou]|uniref:Uncharacterized protein n=1 Tax=Citrus x changshan-huyou TaxID=2935761 RepID=A0AAP0LYP7_9ROSI